MNYFKFNEEYMQIYKERFRVIDNTDFEYSYLESELYAIRKIGESDFVIVTARSPQKALDKLFSKKMVVQFADTVINIKNIESLN